MLQACCSVIQWAVLALGNYYVKKKMVALRFMRSVLYTSAATPPAVDNNRVYVIVFPVTRCVLNNTFSQRCAYKWRRV